jgi:hypothetical protein
LYFVLSSEFEALRSERNWRARVGLEEAE